MPRNSLSFRCNPLFSGMISGIIGGIVVGSISKSPLSVSGPAAGLTAIVREILQLDHPEGFLLRILAGIFQVILGIVKAGTIGYYFPSNVINGMLIITGVSSSSSSSCPICSIWCRITKWWYIKSKRITYCYRTGFERIQPWHLGSMKIVSICLSCALDKYKPSKLKLVPGLTGSADRVWSHFIFI